jgi:hypothetical protein
MPEERKIEAGEIHPKFWERTVKEAFKTDYFRIIIELVKNAADSYTRLERKGKAKPPFEIYVTLYCRRKDSPRIEILDNAEGMDSKKLKESLKYGTQTSMGEDIEALTSAEKGIGLKDAMMALNNNWLITIKNGLLNERNKHPNFNTGIGKEDDLVTDQERKNLGIRENGTKVIGTLPDYFRERKFSTIIERLMQHFLMRKLLENDKFKIYAINGRSRENVLLKHVPPKAEKQILNETFQIEYNKKKYKVRLILNKSNLELPTGKPFGESGLIFFYGEYSVVDFTFCGFDKDLSFSKCFGEVKMGVEQLVRDYTDAPLVDEKRKGLNPEHPFNQKLVDEVTQRLKAIEEEEEASKYSLDETTEKDILRELNKIYKEVKGVGGLLEPQIKPLTFAFYPAYVSIKEYEPKVIALIINSFAASDDFELSLQSTNPDIIITRPKNIKIEERPTEKFVIKQIEIYSEKADAKGEIIASRFPYSSDSAKIGIEVLKNPIFSPLDGFAFVPDKTSIVDNGEKKVELCIDKTVVGESRRIALETVEPINSPGEWLLSDKEENLKKYIVKNILKIEIPIKVKGTGHIGDKGTVKASYENLNSIVKITVVPEPSIAGLFRGIRLSPKETERVCRFEKDDGIIYVYYKHPLVKKYMQKNFRNRLDFIVFIADALTREAIRAIVTKSVEESASKFAILDMQHPEIEMEQHIVHEYFKTGTRMHDMFIQLARTVKLAEK